MGALGRPALPLVGMDTRVFGVENGVGGRADGMPTALQAIGSHLGTPSSMQNPTKTLEAMAAGGVWVLKAKPLRKASGPGSSPGNLREEAEREQRPVSSGERVEREQRPVSSGRWFVERVCLIQFCLLNPFVRGQHGTALVGASAELVFGQLLFSDFGSWAVKKPSSTFKVWCV